MAVLNKWSVSDVQFNENGILPVIVQDYESGEVLMLAYMNAEAAEKTIESGYAHYCDCSGVVDTFGASLGNTQKVISAFTADGGKTLLLKVRQNGNAHPLDKSFSCFDKQIKGDYKDIGGEMLGRLQRIVAEYKKNPEDGGYTSFCLCEECRKLDPVNSMPVEMSVFVPVRKRIKYVALSDRVLHFTNQIVEEILKEVPGKQFCFYAYSAYADPPVKLKPHPSLIIFSVACNYINEDSRQKGLKTIASWSRFGNPLLWRPNAFWGYRQHLMPQNFGRKMFNDIELLKANNLVGNDIDCFEGIWAFKGFTNYAAAKAQLNYEKVDFDTIFDDFCQQGFGKAASEIKNYHLIIEKMTDECAAAGTGRYFDFATDARVAEMQKCLDRAKELVKDEPEYLARIEFLQTGLNVGNM